MTNKTFKELMKTPDPEVYREAARLIQSGHTNLSCLAIDYVVRGIEIDCTTLRQAIERNYLLSRLSRRYIFQYIQMFGPSVRDRNIPHPFWNKRPFSSKERNSLKNYRVNALLFMAAICENPA